MNDFRADLHCHSTCSDGSETPEELVAHAVKIGLKGLAITDHDNTDAYSMALPHAIKSGLKLLTGVEFSTNHLGHSVHILGYAFIPGHPSIEGLCKLHRTRRKNRNCEILRMLANKGMVLTEEEVQSKSNKTTGRPHIAQAMVERGYVSSINEAFNKWIGDGKPCFVRGETVSTEVTIEIIHKARGLAVIAHPHLIDNPSLIDQLTRLSFDGIECYYARFSHMQEKKWLDIASMKGWIATGGSDFHGSVKPETPLGASWVDEKTFQLLEDHGSSHKTL